MRIENGFRTLSPVSICSQFIALSCLILSQGTFAATLEGDEVLKAFSNLVKDGHERRFVQTEMYGEIACQGALSQLPNPTGVINKDDLIGKVRGTRTRKYIKDLPMLGYVITSDKFEDIPIEIRSLIGEVDQTKYSKEYLAANIGSIIGLQMKKDGTSDFYIVDKSKYLGYGNVAAEYRNVDLDQYVAKNVKGFNALKDTSIGAMIARRDSRLVAALKLMPVEMARASQTGFFPVDRNLVIDDPWGSRQTKPAGQDAFFVWDDYYKQYYMVNQDTDGLPISYIEAEGNVADTENYSTGEIQEILERYDRHKFFAVPYIKDLPIAVLNLPIKKRSDVPDFILSVLGDVDYAGKAYNDQYFVDRPNARIALQMNGSKPDFYPIADFTDAYEARTLADVQAKNTNVFNELMKVPGMRDFLEKNPELVIGGLKPKPVAMLRMSDYGFSIDNLITVGKHTKPAGRDAWLTWYEKEKHYYMINADDNGMPIGYVRVKK